MNSAEPDPRVARTLGGGQPRPSDDVLVTELPDGESVLLDLVTEAYFGLNESGTAVWAVLCGGTSLDELVEATSGATDTPAETVLADIDAFISDLRAHGLVVDD